jgi:hypothetical protein
VDAGTLRAGVVMPASTRWLPRGMVAVIAIVGGALIVAGSLMPWLSLYAGLDTISGVDGINGRVLIVAGALSVTAGVLYGFRPSRQLQYGLAVFGFAASAFAAWVLSQRLGSFQHLQGDPFVVASLGAGTFVALGGALLVLGTLLVPAHRAQGRGVGNRTATALATGPDARTILLIGSGAFLVSAAMIHLSVVGPHLEESTLYAVFFIAAAIAQLVAAMSLTMTQDRRVLVGIIAGNALVIVVWALSRTVGLPIGPTPGIAESVSLPDVLATVAEAAIVALSIALCLIRRPLPMRRCTAGAAAVVMCVVALGVTIAAVVGVQAGGG